jgi:hypothetical protein
MRPAPFVWVLLAGIAIPAAGMAEEVTFGVRSRAIYDTSAYTRDGRRVNAWSVGLGPETRLRSDPGGRLGYTIRYNAWYSNRRPKTQLTFSDSFAHSQQAVFDFEEQEIDGQTVRELDAGRRTLDSNRASFSLKHSITSRIGSSITFSHSLREFSSEDQFDSFSLGGQASLGYQLSPRDRLSLGGGYNRQSIEGTDERSGSRTSIYRVFAGWSRQLSPTMSFNVRGGPTLIDSKKRDLNTVRPRFPRLATPGGGVALIDFDTCTGGRDRPLDTCSFNLIDLVREPFPPSIDLDETTTLRVEGVTDTKADALRTTFFGQASLAKSWHQLSAQLSYRRTESPTSGIGTSTTVDSASGSLRWKPHQDWTFTLRGGWSQRTALTDSLVPSGTIVEDSGILGQGGRRVAQSSALLFGTVSSGADVSQWTFAASAQHRLTRRSSLNFDFRFNDQNSKGTFAAVSRAARYNGTISFGYTFDPMRF